MRWTAWETMGWYGALPEILNLVVPPFYEKGSRGGKVIRPKLLHRKAAIQPDGYTVYENIEKSQMEGIVTLYCMAHARRKNWLFVDSDESAKDAAVYMTLVGSCNLLGKVL